MVGGYIEVQNAFLTGYEETVSYKQVTNPSYVASQPPGEAAPENKFDKAQEMRREREDVERVKRTEPKEPGEFPGEMDPYKQAASKPKSGGGGRAAQTQAELDL